MRNEVIQADTIDAAVERILEELKDDTTRRSSRNRENVIYFDGWDGLGASAVLQAVAYRLTSASKEELALAGLQFQQIIHIDCTKWQSRRAMQRLIAEQLRLPASVMEALDQLDDEEDYHGAAVASRAEIPEVVREIYRSLQNHRFLVIFRNGGNGEIDLADFGFPLQDLGFPLYSSNRVLWTFQGSFRLNPRKNVEETLLKSTGMTTGVFLSASRHERDPQELWSYLVLKEAEEVAGKSTGCVNEPAQVADCFLYMLKLCCMGQHLVDYDVATHGSNYWICDGIILRQLQQVAETDDGDGLWRAAAALQSEMRLDVNYLYSNHHYFHLERSAESMTYWSSPPYLLVPVGATLDGHVFNHFNKLGVLKLSRCTLSFSSPPFLRCHNLRFLWLDHCEDDQVAMGTDGPLLLGKEKVEEEQDCQQRFFQRLWVLEVRYTSCGGILSAGMLDLMIQLRELHVTGAQDLDIGQLQGRLPSVRKLRVRKSTIVCTSCSEGNLILGMNKMELLDFSGNRTMPNLALSEMSSSSQQLETVTIIDGCVGIEMISFKGCAKLKNLLLSGSFKGLRILDLSGTAIRTLDLSAMADWKLYELLLDDCKKLCAILWPQQDKGQFFLNKLHLDTTESASAAHGASAGSILLENMPWSDFDWHVSVRDVRLLGSLVPLKFFFDANFIAMEISSCPSHPADDDVAVGSSKDERIKYSEQQQQQRPQDNTSTYEDTTVALEEHLKHASQCSGGNTTIEGVWSHGAPSCYMHIQMSCEVVSSTAITIPDVLCSNTQFLHVHDSLSITHVPGTETPGQGFGWKWLVWCRVERCPSLDCAFTCSQLGAGPIFPRLMTVWVSQLPKARFIWSLSRLQMEQIINDYGAFLELQFLHVDLCPRLTYVLPLPWSIVYDRLSLQNLETLEIVWCGDLKDIFFPLYADAAADDDGTSTTTMVFSSLKRIHLHELPKLEGICGSWRISAPMLESVKIRGCWSLKRLPAVGSDSEKVECDCEKEWWDKLEWDGLDDGHHPSLYKPTHPRYYKKTLLRGTVLIW